MSEKVALVTGASAGIGEVSARELAADGWRVYVAGRSAERMGAAVERIKVATGSDAVWFLPLDLGDLASVKACAEAFLARDEPLHVLMNNAGVAAAGGLTTSGFEVAFGTNHLGHFLLTELLLDRLKASAPARVVTVASAAHYRAKGVPWDTLREAASLRGQLSAYSVSKLANVLFSAELARRCAGTGVTTYSLHPGVVASEIWRRLPAPIRGLIKLGLITVEVGAKTQLRCATAPELADETGLYYDKGQPRKPSRLARDEALAAELWRRSDDFVREYR